MRARLLQRFGRYGYFRVLLSANDVPALLDSIERLDNLARRDGRLVLRHREAEVRLRGDVAREEALKAEIDRLYARSRQEETAVASLRNERERAARQRARPGRSRAPRGVAAHGQGDAARTAARNARPPVTGEQPVARRRHRPWKGVLDWPARGTIVETFGRHRHPQVRHLDGLQRRRGWRFRSARPCAPCTRARRSTPSGSPSTATSSSSTTADGMLTLYAWLQARSRSGPGCRWRCGAEIGLAGYGPGRDEPGLYFEVRDRQKAMRPGDVAARGQEAGQEAISACLASASASEIPLRPPVLPSPR